MALPNLRDLLQQSPEIASEGGVPPSPKDLASLYSWTVKDCRIGSWYKLSDPYSVDEMWRFLRQGRFSHARRVE
jgi:hypothetical protein